jgi:hypothetical protein
MTRNLVVGFDGVGSDGAILVTLADVRRHVLPDTEFAGQMRPLFGNGLGRQWFERR